MKSYKTEISWLPGVMLFSWCNKTALNELDFISKKLSGPKTNSSTVFLFLFLMEKRQSPASWFIIAFQFQVYKIYLSLHVEAEFLIRPYTSPYANCGEWFAKAVGSSTGYLLVKSSDCLGSKFSFIIY